jgi:hypothetical protein
VGPKRDEVTGGCRKLHNEELHDFYSLPSIIRIMKSRRRRLAGHVERMGTMTILEYWWERHKESPLGRRRRTWVDNIKINLRGLGWGGTNWIDLTQDRDQWRIIVITVMNLRVP